ncbi:hypothetical protein vseg_018195 [Gypsophila vaccaria]
MRNLICSNEIKTLEIQLSGSDFISFLWFQITYSAFHIALDGSILSVFQFGGKSYLMMMVKKLLKYNEELLIVLLVILK